MAVGDDEIWERTGDFLQDKLMLGSDKLSQDDIEESVRVEDRGVAGVVRNEVLVTFFSPDIRDTVMLSAKNLAGEVDSSGLPLAGVRLEIPPELMDTFKLLSRFGTRLRARHGEGTRRHIKFDDFSASLYTIIKLPGDSSWTRVSPATARSDLDASFREEEKATQKRLAAKLLPGPRERLRRPVEALGGDRRMIAAPEGPRQGAPATSQRPRPKWRVPERPST